MIGSDNTGSIHAVLLAAGVSRRMGGEKLLMKIGGQTVFMISLGRHLGSSLAGVCAVVPGWKAGFREIVETNAGPRTAFVEMGEPGRMSDSLKAGWGWTMDNTDACAVMISLADQPLVDSTTLDVLMDAYRSSARPICAPVHKGMRGHPVIIGRDLDREIMKLEGDMGARAVLERHPEHVLEVEVGSDEVVLDLDRAEDFEVMKARLTGSA